MDFLVYRRVPRLIALNFEYSTEFDVLPALCKTCRQSQFVAPGHLKLRMRHDMQGVLEEQFDADSCRLAGDG